MSQQSHSASVDDHLRSDINSKEHPPTFCQCRCPCHESKTSESNFKKERNVEKVTTHNHGMSWAEGSVRHTVRLEKSNPIASDGDNNFKKETPKGTLHAPECFSKSLLHVKNMVKTMTAKWEESMSEPTDDNTSAGINSKNNNHRCLECASSHKWNTKAESDDNRDYQNGRKGDSKFTEKESIPHKYPYSLEQPLRLNHDLKPTMHLESTADKKVARKLNKSRLGGSSYESENVNRAPERTQREEKVTHITNSFGHEKFDFVDTKSMKSSKVDKEEKLGESTRITNSERNTHFNPTNPFAVEIRRQQEQLKVQPNLCDTQLQKENQTNFKKHFASEKTHFAQSAQVKNTGKDFHKIDDGDVTNGNKTKFFHSNTSPCRQQKISSYVKPLERGDLKKIHDDNAGDRTTFQGVPTKNCHEKDENSNRDEETYKMNISTSIKSNLNSGNDKRRTSDCPPCLKRSFLQGQVHNSCEHKLNDEDLKMVAEKSKKRRHRHQIGAGSHHQHDDHNNDEVEKNGAHDEDEILQVTDFLGGKNNEIQCEGTAHLHEKNVDFAGIAIQTSEWHRSEAQLTLCNSGNGNYKDNPELNDKLKKNEIHNPACGLEYDDSDDEPMKIDDYAHTTCEKDHEPIKLLKSDQAKSKNGTENHELDSNGKHVDECGSTYMAWISLPSSKHSIASNKGTPGPVEKKMTADNAETHRINGLTAVKDEPAVLIELSEGYDNVIACPSNVKMETIALSTSLTNVAVKKITPAEHRIDSVKQCTARRTKSTDDNIKSRAGMMLKMDCAATRHFHICHGCQKIVEKTEGTFSFMGDSFTAWHPQCFRCHKCDKELTENDHSFLDEVPYCSKHFLNVVNIPKCSKCQELIFDPSYTSAGGNSWHKEHFTCHDCKKTLENTKFVLVRKAFPYCFDCHKRNFPKHCQTCRKWISLHEAFVQNGDLFWHTTETCLHCSTCSRSLVGRNLIFRKGNQLYCNRYCAISEV